MNTSITSRMHGLHITNKLTEDIGIVFTPSCAILHGATCIPHHNYTGICCQRPNPIDCNQEPIRGMSVQLSPIARVQGFAAVASTSCA